MYFYCYIGTRDYSLSILLHRQMFLRDRFQGIRQLLVGLPHADAADLLEHLDPVEMAVSFRLLPKTVAAEIFEYIDANHQEDLIRALGDKDAASILNAMSDDDRTAFLEECPEHAVSLLSLLDPAQQRVALQLLGYPENSVGRMMTTKFVSIRQNWTIQQALDNVKERAKDVYYVHVVCSVDEAGKLLGVHRIRDIFTADAASKVSDLPAAPPIYLKVTDSQADAVKLFRKHSRTIIPVVNADMIVSYTHMTLPTNREFYILVVALEFKNKKILILVYYTVT